MYIHSLTLQGIKSYKKECIITFKEGINFIAGKNGAGKTTIIESIGYLLFWIRPYQYKELLASGEKEGHLSITFRGNDERMYRISRCIRKDKCKYVRLEDLQTGQLLEGEDIVREKLFSIHNVYSLEHLEELFLEIVAVAQGKFTAPFLENGMEKKRKFERMFGLETYEEAYKLSSPLPGLLKEQITSISEEIADISGRLSTKEEELEKKNTVEKKLQQLAMDIQRKKEEQAVQESHFAKEKEKKSQLEALKEKLALLRHEYKLLATEKEHLEVRLKEAQEAEKICIQHKEAHLAYLSHEKEKNALHEELETLRKIEETDMQLQAKEAGVQSTLSQLATHIEELEKELTIQQKEAVPTWDNNTFEEARASLHNSRIQLQRIQKDMNITESLKQDVHTYKTFETTYTSAQEKKALLTKELSSYASLEKEEKALYAEKEHFIELERRYDELTTLLHINTAEYEKCKSDRDSCSTGCPTCGSIGDFSTHFAEKMQQLEKASITYTKEQHSIKKKLQEKKKLLEQEAILLKKKEAYLLLVHQLAEVEKVLSQTRYTSPLLQQLYPKLTQASELEDIISKRVLQEHQEEELWRVKEQETLVRIEGQKKAQEFFEKQQKSIEEKKSLLKEKKQLAHTQTLSRNAIQEERKALLTSLGTVQEKRMMLAALTERMQHTKAAHQIFLAQEQTALKLPLLCESIASKEGILKEQRALGEDIRMQVELREQDFSQEHYSVLEEKLSNAKAELRVQENDVQHLTQEHIQLEKKLLQFAVYEKTQEEKKALKEKKEKQLRRLECVRTILNTAAEPISARFRSLLSDKAALFFRRLSPEPSMLSWGEQFEVFLMKDKDHIRRFQQLSGGEQMIAALAIRLALMRYVSPFSIGFFDEPTQNLDETHRRNLASLLPHVLDGFTQLFLISHDDTFDSLTEHVIMLEKTEEGTQVVG